MRSTVGSLLIWAISNVERGSENSVAGTVKDVGVKPGLGVTDCDRGAWALRTYTRP